MALSIPIYQTPARLYNMATIWRLIHQEGQVEMRIRRFTITTLLAAILLLPATATWAAYDAFLKIDGIPGESTDSKHKDWIEILSFSHGLSQPSGGKDETHKLPQIEGQEGKGSFGIRKALDKASPKLFEACASGRRLTAQVELVTRTPDRATYMIYKLSDVIVSSYKISRSGAQTRPMEEVSFNYGRVEWKCTPRRPDTVPKGNLSGGPVAPADR